MIQLQGPSNRVTSDTLQELLDFPSSIFIRWDRETSKGSLGSAAGG